jgi:hypothetical protein
MALARLIAEAGVCMIEATMAVCRSCAKAVEHCRAIGDLAAEKAGPAGDGGYQVRDQGQRGAAVQTIEPECRIVSANLS